MFRRVVRCDPLAESIQALLLEVKPDPQGVAIWENRPLTTKLLAEAVGFTVNNHSVITRVGKIMSSLGYARIAPTRTLPARWRMPKEIGA
jgi:hypothetical protein